MENEKRNFMQWVKVHKKELIIAGVSIATIIAVVLGYKNRRELLDMWKMLEGKIKQVPQQSVRVKNVVPADEITATEPLLEVSKLLPSGVPELPQQINPHIRNLHEGWRASAEKIATAAEHGYSLQPGQTWVEGYTKYVTAA